VGSAGWAEVAAASVVAGLAAATRALDKGLAEEMAAWVGLQVTWARAEEAMGAEVAEAATEAAQAAQAAMVVAG